MRCSPRRRRAASGSTTLYVAIQADGSFTPCLLRALVILRARPSPVRRGRNAGRRKPHSNTTPRKPSAAMRGRLPPAGIGNRRRLMIASLRFFLAFVRRSSSAATPTNGALSCGGRGEFQPVSAIECFHSGWMIIVSAHGHPRPGCCHARGSRAGAAGRPPGCRRSARWRGPR